MVSTVVVLAAPLGPMIPKLSPWVTVAVLGLPGLVSLARGCPSTTGLRIGQPARIRQPIG
jgi:hypothetical protein